MAEPVDTVKPRTSLWVKITLFVSLALNLIILGLIAGVIARGGPIGDRAMASASRAEFRTPFVRALEPEQRREVSRDIRRSLRDLRDDGGEGPRVMRAALHRDALEMLRAEDFDADAFGSLMAQQSEITKVFASAGAKALARHLGTLSRADRLAYADRVEIAIKNSPRRKPER